MLQLCIRHFVATVNSYGPKVTSDMYLVNEQNITLKNLFWDFYFKNCTIHAKINKQTNMHYSRKNEKFHVHDLDYVPYYLTADPEAKVNLICYRVTLE